MSKDPAFLFYSDNFQSGTQFFTDEQTGKYIRLLCAQHLHGHLEEKHMLHICKTYDKDIWSKFKKDGDGKYYNERLEFEILRRKNYSESRASNRKSNTKNKKPSKNISSTYVNHMGNENGIGNEIEFKDWDIEKTLFKNAYEWKEDFCRKKNISMPELETKLDEFINDIELREEYKSVKKLKSHFTNTFNKQKNGNTITSASNKHKGAMQLVASLKQDFANRRKENPGT